MAVGNLKIDSSVLRLFGCSVLVANLPALAGGLSLLVLGSGGPRPFGRAATSYIVEVNGTPRILVDAGPGMFLRVGELNINLEQVETVLLTHLHIDHTGDLAGFFLARSLTVSGSSTRFNVFGPAGGGAFPSTSRFVNLLFEKSGAWEYQKTFGADEAIHVMDLPTDLKSRESQILYKEGLRITALATHHGDCPSVAYRVDYQNESIAFSGDMDASALPNLIRLANSCSLLVFHCAVLDPPNSPALLYTLHTAPKHIGEAARDAQVKRLLLSHTAPDVEAASRSVLESIHASYNGPAEFAHDKLRVAVTTTMQ